MRKRLGCLSSAGLATAALTALIVALLVLLTGGQLFSPGQLNADAGEQPLGGVNSHAEIGGRCAACHAPPWGADGMSERCLVCHTAIDAQIRDKIDLHGALLARDNTLRCYACHQEHQGKTAPLTVVDPHRFPHDATGYSLRGHQTLPSGEPFTCTHCHNEDLTRFEHSVCLVCHTELAQTFMEQHRTEFGVECLSCHDGLDTYGQAFDHAQLAFPLLGQHALADCAGCHQGARSPADLQGTMAECFACHQQDDAHAGGLTRDCGACHTPVAWQQATFEHSQTGFSLLGQHRQIDCVDCHVGQRFQDAPKECVSCHAADDPHEGLLGQDCARCHTPVDWGQVAFDHNQSAFPLEGAHQQGDCDACHSDLRFKGTPKECIGCHTADDPHEGLLGQDCAACHVPVDWDQAAYDHNQSAFSLEGAHKQVDCDACHPDLLFKGTPKECIGCHNADDPHEGLLGQDCAACHSPKVWDQVAFDHNQSVFPLEGAHQQVDCDACHSDLRFPDTSKECIGCHTADDPHEGLLGQDCARCHTPVDWDQVAFDHNQSAFPLEGAHQRVDCDQCHKDSRFLGTVQDCFSCHREEDAHDGRFGTACGQCHTPLGWGQVTFDHNLTAFPLSGTHRQVDCLQCHQSGIFAGTPALCVACHAEPAFHAGMLGTNCEACHNTVAWLPSLYDRSHTFPLAHGSSAPSSCRTCHPQSLGAYTCYTCHEHDPARTASEHIDEGISDFQNCVRCHPTGLEDEAENGGGDGDDDGDDD